MADLHSLCIAFRTPGSSIRLMYKNGNSVRNAYAALSIPKITPEEEARGIPLPMYDPNVEITDDYGTIATVDRDQIMLRWATNLGEEAEGQKDFQVLQAHMQHKLQRQLAADPVLKGLAVPFQMPQKMNG